MCLGSAGNARLTRLHAEMVQLITSVVEAANLRVSESAWRRGTGVESVTVDIPDTNDTDRAYGVPRTAFISAIS